jgi:hypothetical protein
MQLDFATLSSTSIENENEDTRVMHELNDNHIQLQAEEDLQHQQACLHAWNALQEDIQQLYNLFIEFNKVVYVSTLFHLESHNFKNN